jgi:hypothetical protein
VLVARGLGTRSLSADGAGSCAIGHVPRTKASGSCHAYSSGPATEPKGLPTHSCARRSNLPAAKVPLPLKAGLSQDPIGGLEMRSSAGRRCSKIWDFAAWNGRVRNARSCGSSSAGSRQSPVKSVSRNTRLGQLWRGPPSGVGCSKWDTRRPSERRGHLVRGWRIAAWRRSRQDLLQQLGRGQDRIQQRAHGRGEVSVRLTGKAQLSGA